jgi:hypothetical protein
MRPVRSGAIVCGAIVLPLWVSAIGRVPTGFT